MSDNTAYQQMIVKLNTLYEMAEIEIQNEIEKMEREHSQTIAELSNLKDKHEVLLFAKKTYESCAQQSEEFEKTTQDILQKIHEKNFIYRVKSEKELLLYGFIIRFEHQPNMSLPEIIDLNREYKARKQKIVCEMLSSYLLEEQGYEKYHAHVAEANQTLEIAIDLGDIEKLNDAISQYQRIFAEVLKDNLLAKDAYERFLGYSKYIIKQMEKTRPITCGEVVSVETIQQTYANVKNERLNYTRELEKWYYQFSILHSDKQAISSELRKARNALEDLVYREFNLRTKITQLKNDNQALITQKKLFLERPNVTNYDQAMANLDFIEKRFKRMLKEGNFEKPSMIEKFFTINKSPAERTYIKEEKSNFRHILDQIVNNDNISIEQKRALLRLSRESVLVNTHSGKFFFQRMGKTGTYHLLDDWEAKFSPVGNYSLQH